MTKAKLGSRLANAWMRFAHSLGVINTALLLIIIFFLVVTPMAIVLRIVGLTPLETRINKRAESYRKSPRAMKHNHMEKPY